MSQKKRFVQTMILRTLILCGLFCSYLGMNHCFAEADGKCEDVPEEVIKFARAELGPMYHPRHIEMLERTEELTPEYDVEEYAREFIYCEGRLDEPFGRIDLYKFSECSYAHCPWKNLIVVSPDSMWVFVGFHNNVRLTEFELSAALSRMMEFGESLELYLDSLTSGYALSLVTFMLEMEEFLRSERILITDSSQAEAWWAGRRFRNFDSNALSVISPPAVRTEESGYIVEFYWIDELTAIHHAEVLVGSTGLRVHQNRVLRGF